MAMPQGFLCAGSRQLTATRPPPRPEPPKRYYQTDYRVSQVHSQTAQPVPHRTPAMVTFRATVHDMREEEQLYLVGGVKELGIWDATRAKQMFSSDGKTWTIKLELMPHREIEYKYIRIFSGGDKSWVVWEKGPNSGNRKFYWNGVTVSQDDGLISSFEENKELQTEPYAFAESQEIVAAGCGENSAENSVSIGWFSKEDVPKWTWVNDRFEKLQSAVKSLEEKLEPQIDDLLHRQDCNEKSINQLRRILAKIEEKIGDVEDKIEENAEAHCSLSQKQKDEDFEIACLRRKMQKTTDDSDKRLENLEKVIDCQKCDVDTHSKSLVRLQRQINDLELKIPDTDDGTAPTAPPSHAARVDSQSPKVQPTFEQNEGLDEWKEVASKSDASKPTGMDVKQSTSKTTPASNKPDDSKSPSMDVKQPPSKTGPACGKSDVLKATNQSHPETKSLFCGFQHPPKPEDEDMAKICSKVEEELCEARRRDLPVDARKSLLRKSLLRLHPDKGKPSAGAIWIEDWKNTHIKWYYYPHPVPEDQQKYLTKPGSTKDP